MIVSVFRTGKNYYLQMFLENVNFLLKKKRCLSKSSSDYEIVDSDKEIFSEENSDEKNSNEEN